MIATSKRWFYYKYFRKKSQINYGGIPMKEIHQLRRIAVKLGVSGTAIPIAETRLYKGAMHGVSLDGR